MMAVAPDHTRFLSRRAAWGAAASLVTLGCSGGTGQDQGIGADAVIEWLAEADTTVTQYRDLALVGSEVWALSRSAPFLHRYRGDGALLGTSIPAGDGPGDMRLPNWIVARVDEASGRTAVHIIHRMRELAPVLADGTPAAHRSPFTPGGGPAVMKVYDLAYGQPGLVRALSGNRFLIQWQIRPTVQNAAEIGDALLLLVDSTATPVDTVVQLTDLMPELSSPRVSMFVAVPLWAVCDEERIAVYSPLGDEVVWYRPTGEVLNRQRAGMPVRAVSRSDRERYARLAVEVETRRQGPAAGAALPALQVLVTKMGPGFSATTPPAVNLLCDRDGTAWLQGFDTVDDPRGFGRAWRAVQPSGESRSVTMPPTFHPRAVSGEAFYGWLEDEDGLQRIAMVRPVRSDPAQGVP
jgi:hypothetical protein